MLDIEHVQQGPGLFPEFTLTELSRTFSAEDFDKQDIMGTLRKCDGWKIARIFNVDHKGGDHITEWQDCHVTNDMVSHPRMYEVFRSERETPSWSDVITDIEEDQ